jgi:D-sedoheptulose 7-phosphate isomerase
VTKLAKNGRSAKTSARPSGRSMEDHVTNAFNEAKRVLEIFSGSSKNLSSVHSAINLLTSTFSNGGKVYSCGNGGSMCDAIHFAEELSGKFRNNRAPLPAVAISDPGYLTCVGNDYGYDYIFSRFIEGWGRVGDVTLAISTSGNSTNVINAILTSKKMGLKSIGLLGQNGGKALDLVDIPIIVESPSTDRIQETHIKIIHCLIEGIERNLFPENY